jgi:hypothetical protein
VALGDSIPGEHIVLRHVKGTQIDQGKVDGSAFLRRRDVGGNLEAGLSVEWLEIADGDTVAMKVESIRQSFRREVTSKHRFAALPVGETKRHVEMGAIAFGANLALRFEHEPLAAEDGQPPNPHHSEIFGTPEPEHALAMAIGDLIADKVMELHPAKG